MESVRDCFELGTQENIGKMPEKDNIAGIELMMEMAPYFPHDIDSHARYTKHLMQSMIDGTGIEPEFNQVARHFGMGKDQRRWIRMGAAPEEDGIFTDYINTIHQTINRKWGTPKEIPAEIVGQLLNYTNFKSGRLEINGQTQKLFRYILKEKLLPTNHVRNITTSRTLENEKFLCISKNPVDFIMSSSNQSFTSCINMESNYSKAIYLGLPNSIIDPNQVILFITNRAKVTTEMRTPWGDESLTHFKFHARTWGIMLWDWTLALVRGYPYGNETNEMERILTEIGIKTKQRQQIPTQWTSANIPKTFEKALKSGVPSDPSMSKFITKPLTDLVYKMPLGIYSDYGLRTITKNYLSKREILKKATTRNHNKVELTQEAKKAVKTSDSLQIHTRNGGEGISTPDRSNISYQHGFHGLSTNPQKRLAQFYGQGLSRCTECGKIHSNPKVYNPTGERICLDCHSNYTQCHKCGDSFNKADTSNKKSWHTDLHYCKACIKIMTKGTNYKCHCCNKLDHHQFSQHTPIKGKKVCQTCRGNAVLTNCSHCTQQGLYDITNNNDFGPINKKAQTKLKKLLPICKQLSGISNLVICTDCITIISESKKITSPLAACSKCERIVHREYLTKRMTKKRAKYLCHFCDTGTQSKKKNKVPILTATEVETGRRDAIEAIREHYGSSPASPRITLTATEIRQRQAGREDLITTASPPRPNEAPTRIRDHWTPQYQEFVRQRNRDGIATEPIDMPRPIIFDDDDDE